MATVCDLCTNSIHLVASDCYADHHPTLMSFRQAVNDGCTICCTIMQNIRLDKFSDNILTPNVSFVRYAHYADTGQALSFQFYARRGNRFPYKVAKLNLIPCSDGDVTQGLGVSTGLSSSLNVALDWLKTCQRSHKRCGSISSSEDSKPVRLPSRLLDIGTEDAANLRLVLSSEHEVEPGAQYITLSYTWGLEDQQIKLVSAKLDLFRQGLRISELPRTFQDLVVVTRALGIRYMWIDALCIIQDSIEDWENEGAAMAEVYANSACTIAATASADPGEGLFRHRNPTRVLPRIRDDYIIDYNMLERHIHSAPLSSRGWAFQERMLSPRVLHFAEDQLFWECFQETKCEAVPLEPLASIVTNLGAKSLISNIKGNTRLSQRAWNEVVRQYSMCNLTHDTDKLPALAGLAKAFQDQTNDRYFAGLWRTKLVEQLGWAACSPGRRVSPNCRAPSWSWASVDGAIRPALLLRQATAIPKVKTVEMTTRGPEHFGRIREAYMELSGYLVYATICQLVGGEGPEICKLRIRDTIVSVQLFMDIVDVRWSVGSVILCLPLKWQYDKKCTLTCIILERLGGHPRVEYQRVGLLQFGVRGRGFGLLRSFGINYRSHQYLKEFSLIRIV
ncbi:heterokaryon incompatibility protein [Triangularia verruculosa]|uniref:Heterokaryon incompatibility protein n=1 Tax=Triangularia verruculosa TaxID=2587418 RepID=A0AAN7AQZ8_9PEZI|nr:heterokaryon incompatibility protein [Triangularia verruculosa]